MSSYGEKCHHLKMSSSATLLKLKNVIIDPFAKMKNVIIQQKMSSFEKCHHIRPFSNLKNVITSFKNVII
jgi:hypothetical protein